MIISGLVVQYDPAATESVVGHLLIQPGVSDLTILEPAGRLVFVLEASSPETSSALVDRLIQYPGIYNVMPTYIHELEEDASWSSPAALS